MILLNFRKGEKCVTGREKKEGVIDFSILYVWGEGGVEKGIGVCCVLTGEKGGEGV